APIPTEADPARSLPRDRAVALARATWRRLVPPAPANPLAGALSARLRAIAYAVPPSEVLAVLDACASAGVRCWLAGGWGIDALVGRPTRRHTDIDLCVEVADGGEARAVAALGRLGYSVTEHRAASGRPFAVRAVLRNPAGRVIDLLLVAVGEPRRPSEVASAPPGRPAVEQAVGDQADGSDVPWLRSGHLATGRVGGRTVPCLAAGFQLAVHTGYVPSDRDRRDVATLCAALDIPRPSPYQRPDPRPPALPRRFAGWARHALGAGRAASTLVVPVPVADPVLRSIGAARPGALGAHVTVLYPFLPAGSIGPDDCSLLADIAARIPSFAFRLERTECFDGDVVYLAPDPAAPFVELIAAAAARFPEHPPYGGAFATVVPHVTLAHDLAPEDLAPTVQPMLPIDARADELAVAARDRWGAWRVLHRFPFGAVAPAVQAP
ncbi:MAG: 2'-5' RNA ligase family protein, partial [Acidimicrobiia bacterium]|nr:2'-5' RNA ligase family protein [Acidimicrobiia bacterium]